MTYAYAEFSISGPCHFTVLGEFCTIEHALKDTSNTRWALNHLMPAAKQYLR